jgi:hypothetical protein
MSTVTINWPNGQRKRFVEFEEGLRSGLDQMWNEEGILVDEGLYEKGVPVGTHRRWNGKGVLVEEIHYLDLTRKNYRAWDDEGNLRVEALWHDDQYAEKTWDRFQNVWVEKKGVWDGSDVQMDALPKPNGFSIFLEKYPLLGLEALQWEAKETLFQGVQHFDPGKAEAIFVYGLGNGAPYFQLQTWLHEKKERKLIFLEEETGAFSYFLHLDYSRRIIQDSQVYFERSLDAQFIADKFPIHRAEIVAIPTKNKRRFESLKNDLFRKITLSHAIYQDRLHGYHPYKNFIQNISRVGASFYANGLKDAFQGIPAIVCGAGPSLQEAIPLLKRLSNKALIIAGGSTLAALSSQGVPIHFGVAIDPNLEEYRRMKNSFAFETPLLFSTRVHPQIFQTCNGPFGYMRSGIGGILELWMEESLGLFDPLIGEKLSPESISVTTICMAWAEFLGCSTILFSGVDLAYTNQKRYADGVEANEDVSFSLLDLEKSLADRILIRKDPLGRPIYTATRWVMEAASIGDYAKKHKHISFINTGDSGLKIPGVPFMSLSEATDQYLQNDFDLCEEISKKVARAQMSIKTVESIEKKISELKMSLLRVIQHLEVLAGKVPGSKALAEIEMRDEVAMDLLFYDIFEILQKENPGGCLEEKWDRFLVKAQRYLYRS